MVRVLSALPLVVLARVALARTIELYGAGVDTAERGLLGTFSPRDDDENAVDCGSGMRFDLASHDAGVFNGLQCVGVVVDGVEVDGCCSVLNLHPQESAYELSYNTPLDKYSLHIRPRELDNGTGCAVRYVEDNAVSVGAPPAIALKKRYKTYEDKKKEARDVSVDSDDAGGSAGSDEEGTMRSWIQENWKKLLLGLVIYNVVASLLKRTQPAQKQE
ncbi:Emc10p KNAG_0H01020 [Huiozyma naganishii CBS 8797]|uniref:ER membrane protein complex subunit 10 n=1 Tax=Huiozyma naganishii (strain ATCC MYA-139 / BCRC 22969 / CBS 8797 / KCTC 17520 / NBRC 10181 / NCYC 3082 / Yp74L-3) TaxID=1071383 RepID=J7S9I8_HUIN7|nr:hypothetical protein KNAG_0H01020 [Kazachstania naganishii CBS 8797]CCK71516.1 hypothetical protein KNAG_0H01020 [Kazachstania naganishii CBS 8797]